MTCFPQFLVISFKVFWVRLAVTLVSCLSVISWDAESLEVEERSMGPGRRGASVQCGDSELLSVFSMPAFHDAQCPQLLSSTVSVIPEI